MDTNAQTSHVAVKSPSMDLTFSIDGGPKQAGAPSIIGPLAPGESHASSLGGKSNSSNCVFVGADSLAEYDCSGVDCGVVPRSISPAAPN